MTNQPDNIEVTKRTKINRPLNLSQWVFFATDNDQSFDKLAGGNREYILRVRAANKPVICLKQNKRGKYRWTLEMDMIEGFDGQYKVQLSPDACNSVSQI